MKNVKDPKHLQQYVEEAIESEPYSNNSDADDDDAMLQEFEPK